MEPAEEIKCLIVKTINGKQIEIRFTDSMIVSQLKQKIKEHTGTDEEKQR
jgi:Ubiquitin family